MSYVIVKCPHCNKNNNVELECAYDGEEYDDHECHFCDGLFDFTVEIYVEFSAYDIKVRR